MRKKIYWLVCFIMLTTMDNAMALKHLDVKYKDHFISINAFQTQSNNIIKEIENKTDIEFVFIQKMKSNEVTIEVSNVPPKKIGKILNSLGYTNYAIEYKQQKMIVYILPKGISSKDFKNNYFRIKHGLSSKKANSIKGKDIENIYRHPNYQYNVQCIKNEIILKACPHLNKNQINSALTKYHLEIMPSKWLEKIGYIKAKIRDGLSLNDIIPIIRNNPEFTISEPNYLINSMSTDNQSYQWHIPETKFDQAWPLLRNKNEIVIAIIDSGVNAFHPDLKNKVLNGYDFYNNDADASDDYGHGTFVAGIIAASENSIGVKGLNDLARIIPIKVLGETGQGTYEDTASGIIWAADHQSKIINLSIGSYAFSSLLRDAINYALEKGCVVVSASGNEGIKKAMYPAAYPDVIAVSALGQDGKIWPESNKGGYIDVCAPGEKILSTGLKDSYILSGGTSASAAIVSALAAMLVSEYPDVSNIYVRQRIAQTAEDLGDNGRDPIYGNGKINAYAAFSNELAQFHDVTVRSVDIETSVLNIGQPVMLVAHIVNVGTYTSENCKLVFKQTQKNQTKVLYEQQLMISGVKDIFLEWIPDKNNGNVQFDVEVFCKDDAYPSNNKAFSKTIDITQKDQLIFVQHKSEVEYQVHEFIAGEAWELIRRYMDASRKRARVLSFSSGSSEEMTVENVKQTVTPVSETPTYSPENYTIVFSGSKKMFEEFDDHIGERILHECGKKLRRYYLNKKNGFLNNLESPSIPGYVAYADKEMGSVNLTYTGKIREDAAPGYFLSDYCRDFPFSIYYNTMQMEGARDYAYEIFIEDVFKVKLPDSWLSTGESYSSEDAYEGAENNETGIWGSMTDSKFQSINLGNDDIIEGSHEEDIYDVARNHSHYMGFFVDASNFYHHFWEVDSYHEGAFNDGLVATKHSAWTVSNDFWAFAIDQYKKGNKDKAYYYLGRVVHLLEDMGCPPHVHNDAHPSSAPYEDTMGKVLVNDEIKNREEYPKGRSIYLTWHADTLKKVLATDENSISALEIRNNPTNYLSEDMPLVIKSLDALKVTDPQINNSFREFRSLLDSENIINIADIKEQWLSRSDLFRLFYSMAELTDDFPSGDDDGDIIKNHGDDNNDMKDYNSYHYYAPVIQPAIIEHVASLYLLFWKETHAFVSSSVKNENSQPIVGATVELFEEGATIPLDTAQTDKNGAFSFYDIESEVNHFIRVSKKEYVSYTSVPFQAKIGETIDILPPDILVKDIPASGEIIYSAMGVDILAAPVSGSLKYDRSHTSGTEGMVIKGPVSRESDGQETFWYEIYWGKDGYGNEKVGWSVSDGVDYLKTISKDALYVGAFKGEHMIQESKYRGAFVKWYFDDYQLNGSNGIGTPFYYDENNKSYVNYSDDVWQQLYVNVNYRSLLMLNTNKEKVFLVHGRIYSEYTRNDSSDTKIFIGAPIEEQQQYNSIIHQRFENGYIIYDKIKDEAFVVPHKFSDLKNDWAKKYIEYVARESVVQGYKDGTFGEQNNVTRGELMKMCYKGAKKTPDPDAPDPDFNDVKSEDWLYKYLADAKQNDYVHGKEDGCLDDSCNENCFCPNDPVDRYEAAKIIYNIFEGDEDDINVSDENLLSFPDVPSDFWAYKYVNWFANVTVDWMDDNKGVRIASGYDNGNFGKVSDKTMFITRAEISKIIANLMNLKGTGPKTLIGEISRKRSTRRFVSYSSTLGRLYEQIYDNENSNPPDEIQFENKIITENDTITLNGEKFDQDGDEMFYFWNTTGGNFSTTDHDTFSNMTWTPPDITEETTFTIRVERGDGRGKVSYGLFDVVVTPVEDLEPPNDITGLNLTYRNNTVYLDWTKPQDLDLSNILIVRSEEPINWLPTNNELYYGNISERIDVIYDFSGSSSVDVSIERGKMYYYMVFAYDNNHNYSGGVSMSIQIPPELEATYTTIGSLHGSTTYNSATLTWIAPKNSNYNKYLVVKGDWHPIDNTAYSTGENGIIYNGNGKNFTDNNLEIEKDYHYNVYAYHKYTVYDEINKVYNTYIEYGNGINIELRTKLGGTLQENLSLKPENNPHFLQQNLTIPSGITLTLEKGTIIKVSRNKNIIINGCLNADGNQDQPIIITSVNNSSLGGKTGSSVKNKGDWDYIHFNHGSTGFLKHVTVEYAGGTADSSGYVVNRAALYIYSSPVLDNVTIRNIGNTSNDYAVGIWIGSDGAPIIKNSTIDNIESYGIYAVPGVGVASAKGNYQILNSKINASSGAIYILLDNNTPIISGNDFSGSGHNESALIKGVVTGDMIWDDDMKILNNVSVASGATLTINPGVTIYVSDGNAYLNISGTLNAEANRENERIIFTSDEAEPKGGDWGYIQFLEGSAGKMKYVTIEYAGGVADSSGTIINRAALYIYSSPKLNHVTIKNIKNVSNDYAVGIWILKNATPVIKNSLIKDIESYGIYAESSAIGNYQIIGSTIDTVQSPLYLNLNGNTPIIKENEYLGYGKNDAFLVRGTITGNMTWDNDIKIYGQVVVDKNATLTIQPNVTIYGHSQSSRLLINGQLIAEAPDQYNQIIFTSIKSTPQKGDWDFIQFNTESTGSLKYVTIEYAGGGADSSGYAINRAALYIFSSPVLNHVTIRNIGNTSNDYSVGIWIGSEGAPTIKNCTIDNIESYGIYAVPGAGVSSATGNYQILNSKISASGGAINILLDKNTPFISGNDFSGSSHNESALIKGVITSDMIWDDDMKILNNVSVASGATLTINPGVKIYGSDGNAYLNISGTLNAESNEEDEKIVFTSSKEEPNGGDWGYINFDNNSSGIMKNVIIEYAGGIADSSGYVINRSALYIYSSPILDNVTIRNIGNTSNDYSVGIWIASDGAPIIKNCTIDNIETYGIYAVSGSGVPSAKGNYQILNSKIKASSGAIYIVLDNNTPIISGNDFSGSGHNESALIKGVITGDMIWDDDMKILNNVSVASGALLTINPGVKIYGSDGNAYLNISGSLKAEANEEDEKIVFTSSKEQPNAGDWGYINFDDSSSGIMKNVIIEYAGGIADTSGYAINRSALYIYSSPIIDNVNIRYIGNTSNDYSVGIWIASDGAPIIKNCTLDNIETYGIYAVSGSGVPSAKGNYQILNSKINASSGAIYISLDNNTPIISGNDFSGSGHNESALIKGVITGDMIWDDDMKILNNVSVASGATLTINPGVKIYASDGSTYLNISGTLKAEADGENERIIFTSDEAEPKGGDWGYIQFLEGSAGIMKYVTIEYAGGTADSSGTIINRAALYIYSSPKLDHVTIQNVKNVSNDYSVGVWILENAVPVITNALIKDIESYGIYAESTAVGDYQIINSTINTIQSPLNLHISSNNPIIRDNVYSGSGNNSAFLVRGTISGNMTWDNDIQLYGQVIVDKDATLTIKPNVTISGHSQSSSLLINGQLIAEAPDQNNQILFTSKRETPQKGDWDYIKFNEGSSGSLRNVTIEYAGGGADSTGAIINRAALFIYSSPVLDHVTIRNIGNTSNDYSVGIWIVADGAPIIKNCTIDNIESYGIYAVPGSGVLSAKGNYQILNSKINASVGAINILLDTNTPIISGNDFSGSGHNESALIKGVITNDMRWDDDMKILNNVTVAAGASLTITPGVKIYGSDGNAYLNIFGNLTAEANEEDEKIVFTSAKTQPNAGDWGYIHFNNNSTGIMKNVIIEYAGGAADSTGSVINRAALLIYSSPIIDHVTIKNIGNVTNDYSVGIWIGSEGEPTIKNCTIDKIESYGIYAVSGSGVPSAKGNYQILNSKINASGGAINILLDNNTPFISGNDFSGSGHTESALIKGVITGDMIWDDDMKILNNVSVAAGATLTINPGVKIYGSDGNAYLNISGTLNAEANGEDERIIFTSDETEPKGGDWSYIQFLEGSAGIMKYVTIEYAGGVADSNGTIINRAALYIYSSPILDHVTINNIKNISNDYSVGVWILKNAAPVITNSLITDIESYGIYAESTAIGDYQIINSTINTNQSPLYLHLNGNNPIISNNDYSGSEYNDAFLVRGTITGNMTWDNDIQIYGQVVVDKDATLTIKPNVMIYGHSQSSSLLIKGQLIAEAPDQNNQILFTSKKDTPQKGDWDYIKFNAGSSGSLKNVIIEYAGGGADSTGAIINRAALFIYSSPVLDRVTIRNIGNTSNDYSVGIWIASDGAPIIKNCKLDNIESYGIYAVPGSGVTSAKGNYQILNSIINASSGAINILLDNNTPFISGNDFSGSGHNESALIKGTITNDMVWDDNMKILNNVTVAADASLTINPGVTIYGSDGNAYLNISGTLKAEANGESDRIVFTSPKAEPKGGDWGYIQFLNGSNGIMKYVTIEYSGGIADSSGAVINRAALYVYSSPILDHIIIKNIKNVSNDYSVGIWIFDNALPILTNSVIKNVESYGIYSQANQEITFSNNSIIKNGGGIYSSKEEIDARYISWGYDSGPYHPALNPNGEGNKVSDHVIFEPWLNADKDNDGMSNDYEWSYGLDPFNPNDAQIDQDQDGLTNLDESQFNTNPFLKDSDRDKMPDKWEIDNNLDPLKINASEDLDQDGLTNLEEFILGTNPNNSESKLKKGDLNGDSIVNIKDAIIALQICVDITIEDTVYKVSSINNNNIYLNDAILIIQEVSE